MTCSGASTAGRCTSTSPTAADVHVSPRGTWLLFRIADHAPISGVALARLLPRRAAPPCPPAGRAADAGNVTLGNGASPAAGPEPRSTRARPSVPPRAGPGPGHSDGATAGLLVAPARAGQPAAARLEAARRTGWPG